MNDYTKNFIKDVLVSTTASVIGFGFGALSVKVIMAIKQYAYEKQLQRERQKLITIQKILERSLEDVLMDNE